MKKWLIWVLACHILCGCQASGGPADPMTDEDCPSPHACDDPDTDARLPLGPFQRQGVTVAEYKPMKPGCPSTLQVMASRSWPIAFGLRAGTVPETAPDPSDFFCEPPEAPLQRAGPRRQYPYLATR